MDYFREGYIENGDTLGGLLVRNTEFSDPGKGVFELVDCVKSDVRIAFSPAII